MRTVRQFLVNRIKLTFSHLYPGFVLGEKLVNFLVEPKKGTKWPSKLPRFENRLDAIAVCKDLCKQQFIVRSEKQGKGVLAVRLFCQKCFLSTIWVILFEILGN